MEYLVNAPRKNIMGKILLPTSKSISNRLLIIQTLNTKKFTIENLSDSDDTQALYNALNTENDIIDVGHGGTTMRFLTAFLASCPGEKILTGSERMQQRPIGNLVETLKILGAEINYMEKEGYPPLKITGKQIPGGRATIKGNISSQFISSLLLVAPTYKHGLTLEITDKIISSPYIEMTLKLLHSFGISYTWEKNTIHIPPQEYIPKNVSVEGDWSAASYWFEMAVLSEDADLYIETLENPSLQGDSVVTTLFRQLGIHSTFYDQGVHIRKTPASPAFFQYNFTRCPDLAQTLAVTLCLSGIPFHFTGLETLKIKETNRVEALQTELEKLGYPLSEPAHGELAWKGSKTTPMKEIVIQTYHDHRMAMAFAPIALKTGHIKIADPMVVSKSYPRFWDDLKKTGFSIDSYS